MKEDDETPGLSFRAPSSFKNAEIKFPKCPRCNKRPSPFGEQGGLCRECSATEKALAICGCDVKRALGDSCPECGCNCNPLDQTGGGHHGTCPAYEPECTCYELTGGHMPGCYFHARKRGRP